MKYKELINWKSDLRDRLEVLQKCNISMYRIAREAGISRIAIYKWLDGSMVASVENYANVIKVIEKYEKMLNKR